jgi:hypothetical protein
MASAPPQAGLYSGNVHGDLGPYSGNAHGDGRYPTLRKKFLTQAEYIIKAFVNKSCQLWMMGNE